MRNNPFVSVAKGDIELKADHPEDHAWNCGCSTCRTRRSWIANENQALWPPQVQVDDLDEDVHSNGELQEQEVLAIKRALSRLV